MSWRSIGSITSEHGYYDQAHFIKNFKHFTLFTPRQIIMLLQSPLPF
ncbi:hypothetical protein ACAF76_019940 [Brevibacillus sp. TJ4]